MRALVAWLFLWLSGVTAAQTPQASQFRRFGVDEGLPSSTVNVVVQDRQGYVWVGTKDGLARYDGLEFRIYRYSPGDSSALPGNAVTSLQVDGDGRLWVAVEGHGLSLLNPDHEGFTRLFAEGPGPRMREDVFAMAATPDGAMWIGTYGGGLYRARLSAAGERELEQFLPVEGDPRSLPDANVISLAVDPGGSLWIGTTAGLARREGRTFVREALPEGSGGVVMGLSAEADGGLWIGTSKSLLYRHPDGRLETPAWTLGLAGKIVLAVLRDADDALWIASNRGLDRWLDGRLESIPGPSLITAMADNEGGLWFGSLVAGLARLPPSWRHFSILRGEPGVAGSLSSTQVRGMDMDAAGRVWLVGTGGIVDRYDPDTGKVESLAALSAGLPDKRLYTVLESRDGSLWVGHQSGLSRIEAGTGRMRHWPSAEEGEATPPGPARHLLEAADGNIWVALYGSSLQVRDPSGRIIKTLRPGDGSGLEQPDPNQLRSGPDGSVWVAGGEGLLRWNASTAKLERVPGAPDGRVFGFHYQAPDTLWLVQLGELAAYRWDGRALQPLKRVDSTQGLPAVEFGGVAADASGTLWLTSTRGLVRYDPIGERVRVFGVRDGLPSQEFESLPPILGDDGLGIASTKAGLVLFRPALIRASPVAPQLVVESLRLRRGEDDLSLPVGDVQLLPGDRDLRVIARLLSYDDARAHRYRFRLLGFDPDWIEVDARGERVFSTLPAGRYELEMIASNANGLWSPKRRLGIEVLPPWWRTLWARSVFALLALGLVGLAAWLYRQRLKARHRADWRRQQQRLIEQESQAKTRFLATLGHEIRTPMTGVLGMAELLLSSPLEEKQRGRVEAIQRAGQHLLRLVNDALDLARVEAGKLVLDERAFDLHALLDEVAGLLAPLAQAKGLAFGLQRSPATPRGLHGDPDRIRQILLNLGNNAIKFTECGEVAIRCRPMAPHGVVIEVVDTGPGMSAEQQARLFQRFEQAEGARTTQRHGGSGLGLAISQELAMAMAGRIEVASAPGQGATFTVTLPLANADIGAAPAHGTAAASVAAAPAHRGLRLLLVEDEAMVAEVVVGLLQAMGHEVVHAAQGLAALAELQDHRFDLALLDLDLPGLDGLELARLIRLQGHDLPLLALTARADAEAETLAQQAGMQGFQRKPVTSAMLQSAIEAVLPSRAS